SGCVNTIQWNLSGDLILSGSDDRKLAVTRWIDGQITMQVKALHKTNIMSAKFLPQTGDRQAVSCSGDGVVMVSDLEKEDGSLQDVFRCHQGPVYEVVTVESEPNTFLSVGEDGTARWFDLRATKTCPTLRCKENILFICQSSLSSAAINPVLPHEFAIGTSDSQVYVMDRRKLDVGSLGSPTQSIVSSMRVPSLSSHSYRTTSVQFSPEGDQVLASFSGEGVYLFDVKKFSVIWIFEIIFPVQTFIIFVYFKNRTAINEACFWGRCHIMSGSDCGHVFIWNRQTGKVVSVLQADTRVVNRVRPHPYEPILATSGIDYDIKLWTPSSDSENNINIEEVFIIRFINITC
ncbi:hypothetical protein DAPPUDRAFT_46974, partial [Daphnia pulex]